MEALKKVRGAHRTAFTKALNELNGLMDTDNPDKENIAVAFELLEEKMTLLDGSSARVLEQVLEAAGDQTVAYQTEDSSNDEYKKKYLAAKPKVSRLCYPAENVDRRSTTPIIPGNVVIQTERKKFKLSKIEIAKFSGNVKDWLKFWNQFRKVDEDNSVDDEDKFQLLLQSIETDSRAYDLINSFPPTRENYPKAIESLKNRFGKDELQVEVYVRELLGLVLHNASSGREKLGLATLYDKLETHMRALETLGVTSKKCAAILFPLVESSIPEETLRAWQRSTTIEGATDSEKRLAALLKFLCTEVENEERIRLAVAGFTLHGDNEKVKRSKAKTMNSTPDVPTAAGLFVKTDNSSVCIFCDSDKHKRAECEEAKKLSIEERRKIVKEANCCFNCLKYGHSYKKCKTRIKCTRCSRKHVELMCPENAKVDGNSVGKIGNLDSTLSKEEHNLSSLTHVAMCDVYLQTLRVRMINGEKECVVRALIDSGSQH